MKIIGTGLSGLVGSRIVELLKHHTFENISRETGVEIADRESLVERMHSADASVVLHLAAKTDVDECEKDKPLGENGDAWRVNVGGTRNIVSACEETGKRLIYISTDFVFDGERDGEYAEKDVPRPINWYGVTKYEGEKIVQNARIPWMIARIAYPYRAWFPKNDFVRGLLGKLKEGAPFQTVEDHIMTPTFIDDIAQVIDVLIKTEATGIYHIVGSQHLSPFDAGLLLAQVFDFDPSLISKTTRAEFFSGRAPRPSRLALSNEKIEQLGITMRTFEEGLREIKRQQNSSALFSISL